MTHDTKHGKDTICSSDDTIHSCESETSLTSPGIVVVPLFAELLPARLRGQDGALQVAMGELRAIEEMVLRHHFAKDIDARVKLSNGTSLDKVVGDLLRYPPLTMTDPAGVLSEIEKVLLRTEGTAHSVPVKDLLSAGERLDGGVARVLNSLRRDADKAQAEVKILTGSVDHWKAEAERWKGLSRQAQRERDDWQAQQAKAESENTQRMLERDVLGDKFADALGIPHRTLFAAGELRYGRPLPDGYKDEAEHPLVVRLAEMLTGRPMGTELPESIVARATAEVLSWMDAPKVPVVRLPPMLGRSRDKDESSEVDRWKKAAESESARADRAEARATALESELAGEQLAANSWKSKAAQNSKAASDWESTAKASSARVADLARDLSALRAGLLVALRVHPDADRGDKALVSYAKKAADDSAVDGRAYSDGRAEGRADIAAKLRAIIDPEDKRKLDVDGLLAEVKRIYEHVIADAAALRNAHRAGATGAYAEAARRPRGLLMPNDGGDFTDMVAEVDETAAALRRLLTGPRSARMASIETLMARLEVAKKEIAAANLLARLLHESGRQAVKRGENIAQESTFIEWAELAARVKQGRTMTAIAMLDSVLIAAAPAPAGSTRLSGACLARQIHKCEKAAIESGHTARQHSTTWIPFDELPEAAMKGRLAQAEFLERACDLAFFVWDK